MPPVIELTLPLALVAHGCFAPSQGTQEKAPAERLRIVSVPVSDEPSLDGRGDDAVWRAAPEIRVVARRPLDPNAGASTDVLLRSVHTEKRIFFQVSWADPNADLVHKPWLWSDGKSAYEEGPQREDMLALAFEHTGSFTADMLEPADAVWDVWHWKAARTNPQGFAMDKTHRYTREKPEGKANTHTARDGKPVWISRPEDGGNSVERKQPAPASRAEALVSQYVSGAPSGSAADVAAKGVWTDGRWTLELGRDLATANADDAPFDPGQSRRMAVATFDKTGEMDKATGSIELFLARSMAPFDFEGGVAGGPPDGFRSGRTGRGPLGRWELREESDAPSGHKVVAQVDGDSTDDRFPLLLLERVFPADVEVFARFKPLAGSVDQAGGLVLRARDEDNYYVVRANALEGNVRLYRVKAGKREQFAGVSIPVTSGGWHTLALRAHGSAFEVWFEGSFLFAARDEVFPDGGMVGLWTKADSITAFDDLVVVDG